MSEHMLLRVLRTAAIRRFIVAPALVVGAVAFGIVGGSNKPATTVRHIGWLGISVVAAAEAPAPKITQDQAIAAVRARLAQMNPNVPAGSLGVTAVSYQPGLTQLTDVSGNVIYTSNVPRNAIVVLLDSAAVPGYNEVQA